MIRIRRYTIDDIPTLIDGVEIYLEENRGDESFINQQKHIVIDRNKLYRILTYRIDDPDFFCSVIEKRGGDDDPALPMLVGGMCGLINAPFYSSCRIACDQILYTVPGFHNLRAVMRLIQSYITWAEKRGAVSCLLRTSSGYKPEAFKKLCNRMGFEQIETGFSRRL